MPLTIDEITENFSLLDDWDDRYRYVIELGRSLPPFPEEARTQSNKVQGCASQVWLTTRMQPNGAHGPVMTFLADSDAHIVRGLIAILFALYSGKPARDILSIDALGCSTGSACAKILRRSAQTGCAPWSSASVPRPMPRLRRFISRHLHRHAREGLGRVLINPVLQTAADARCAPKARDLLRSREMSRWAISGHAHLRDASTVCLCHPLLLRASMPRLLRCPRAVPCGFERLVE